MINQESQLKLQAYLDGELSARDAAQVTEWLMNDAQAQALLNELEMTSGMVKSFDESLAVPETREFFWSKIEREIERQEKLAPVADKPSILAWLRSHAMSLGSAAVAVCLLGVVALSSNKVQGPFGEMEVASEDMGAYTFRDSQAQLTTVWLYSHDDDSQFTQTDPAAKVDTE